MHRIHDLYNKNTYFMQKKVSWIDYHVKMKIRTGARSIRAGGGVGAGDIRSGGHSPLLFLFKGNSITFNDTWLSQCRDNVTGWNIMSGVCVMILVWEASVAEWLRPLIFSTLNHSSSQRCGFEPSSCHMWDKPSSACEWSAGFSSVFTRPSYWLGSKWMK